MRVTRMHQAGTVAAIVAAAALTAGAAQAKTLIMATDRAGTLFNAAGSGVAKVATTKSKHRVIVRAFGGPDAYMSALNSGEYDFSTFSSTTGWFNYNGKTKSKRSTKNLRIIRSGAGAIKLSFLVYNESPIKAIADLRGRRVTSDFGGHAAIGPMVKAALGSAGLTWGDVRPVPVSGALEAPRALGSERVDATWAAVGMPVVREIHAKKKVRYLGFENTPASLAKFRRDVFPGIRFVTMPAIKRLGLAAPTTLITTDSYVVTHKNQDPAIVRDIMNALWDNTKDLQKAHFALRGFTHKSAASDLPMMPYHPTAIEFYKSKGLWTDKVDAANKMVMSK